MQGREGRVRKQRSPEAQFDHPSCCPGCPSRQGSGRAPWVCNKREPGTFGKRRTCLLMEGGELGGGRGPALSGTGEAEASGGKGVRKEEKETKEPREDGFHLGNF